MLRVSCDFALVRIDYRGIGYDIAASASDAKMPAMAAECMRTNDKNNNNNNNIRLHEPGTDDPSISPNANCEK